MSLLHVRVGTAEWELEPVRAYVVGRGQLADIAVDDPGVSRHHGDFVFDGAHWTFVDRSSGGSYSAGKKVAALLVETDSEIRLGASGPTMFLALTPGTPAPATPSLDLGADHSQVGTVAVDDTALRLDLDDVHRTYLPGTLVMVGRSSACDMVAKDPIVSGEHCSFEYDNTGWVLQDLKSTRGTYVDGKRVDGPTPCTGAFVVTLGDATAGAELRVVTAGVHEQPKDRRSAWLLAVGVLVVAVGLFAGVTAWINQNTSDPNSDGELAEAKLATVLIASETGSGSGAFVADDLILTNRHVVEGAGVLWVFAASGPEQPVELRYLGEVIASHPFLDLALVQLVAGAEFQGDEFVEAALQAPPAILELGDSTHLRSGDRVNALGFPALTSGLSTLGGELLTPAASVSEGEIVTFSVWPGCESADADLFLTGGGFSRCSTAGNLNRGNLVSSDLSGSGGSGGPIVVDGELVAVRYAVVTAVAGIATTGGAALSIPIEFATEWLSQFLDG